MKQLNWRVDAQFNPLSAECLIENSNTDSETIKEDEPNEDNECRMKNDDNECTLQNYLDEYSKECNVGSFSFLFFLVPVLCAVNEQIDHACMRWCVSNSPLNILQMRKTWCWKFSNE